ncbi:MAG: DUF4403 family protein [Sulfurimonas sp.]|nr:DUF4403 family protein [Sulfurimonas sp.]
MKLLRHFIYLLLLSFSILDAANNEKISQPIYKEPQIYFEKKDSLIQVPISIDAQEIKEAILRQLKTPLSSGITGELIKKELYKILKIQAQVNYKVHLINLKVSFEGAKIKIMSSYFFDFSLDYKQDALSFIPKFKIKGALDGKAYGDLHFVGDIQITKDAKFILKVSQKNVKIKFTKVEIPSLLNKLKFLKLADAELYLAQKYFEKTIHKRIYDEINKQILIKQVDIKLSSRIQALVYNNSFAWKISKDLWLLPRPKKVALTQVHTHNGEESNKLFINVGITAQPKLVTSTDKPFSQHKKNIPIALESFEPKVYLYPSIHLQYKYIEKRIQKEFNAYIYKSYADTPYIVENIKLYPSDKKLVIAVDLVDKITKEKILTFYLWGTPHLDAVSQIVQLKDLDYTHDSKNVLIQTADWILDDAIKNLIQSKSSFNYSKELSKLSKKVSSIQRTTLNGTLSGQTKSISIENIYTAKDALVITLNAKGIMSYALKIKEKRTYDAR